MLAGFALLSDRQVEVIIAKDSIFRSDELQADQFAFESPPSPAELRAYFDVVANAHAPSEQVLDAELQTEPQLRVGQIP